MIGWLSPVFDKKFFFMGWWDWAPGRWTLGQRLCRDDVPPKTLTVGRLQVFVWRDDYTITIIQHAG